MGQGNSPVFISLICQNYSIKTIDLCEIFYTESRSTYNRGMTQSRPPRRLIYRLRTGVQYDGTGSVRRRKFAIGALVFLVVMVVIIAKIIAAPAHGHQIPVDRQARVTPKKSAPVLPASEIPTSYFRLALPAGYKPQTAETVPGLLYSQTLTKPSLGGTMVVSIAVKTMPEGGLDGEPSYRLRQSKPTQYRQSTQSVQGGSATVFNDAESASVVAFMPHGSYLATVSVTLGISNPSSDDNSDELKVLQPILAAWQWR